MAFKVSALYGGVQKTLIEFFQKTSLSGFGLLYNIRRRKYQRLLWSLFLVMGICFAIYVVIYTLFYFSEHPVVTALSPYGQDIINIPFPAVAVCSTNKLSRTAVEQLARWITVNNPQHNYSYWLERVRMLDAYFQLKSDLYNLNESNIITHTELDHLTGSHLGIKDDLTKLLMALTPPCDEQLISCRLAGIYYDCSELMQPLAIGGGGFCCVFNYDAKAKRQRHTKNNTTILDTNSHNYMDEMNGLTLLLNTSTADNFYGTDKPIGYTVRIFHRHVFPDAWTGQMQEFSASAGEAANVELHVRVQITMSDVRSVSVQRRRCYFEDEDVLGYEQDVGISYSQAACLTNCRLRSILTFCKCLPYFATQESIEESIGHVRFCTLKDYECIKEYVLTTGNNLVKGSGTMLNCSHCLPQCNYFYYGYNKRSGKLSQLKNLSAVQTFLKGTRLDETVDLQDYSTVNLFFGGHPVRVHTKRVLFNWYQILSNVGGIISICIGCSLMSGIEIIYFAFYRLLCHIRSLL